MRRPARRCEILGLLLSGLSALALAACTAGDPTVAPPVGAPTSSASPSVTADPTSTTNSPSISTPTEPRPSVGGSTVVADNTGGSSFTVTRTGGLAGVMQSLAIASDGSWFFTDRRDGSSQRGTFTTAQAQRLAALAADPALRTEGRSAGQAGVCNDGYIYTISVGEGPIRYEQCGGGQNRPVTQELVTLLVDATPL